MNRSNLSHKNILDKVMHLTLSLFCNHCPTCFVQCLSETKLHGLDFLDDVDLRLRVDSSKTR